MVVGGSYKDLRLCLSSYMIVQYNVYGVLAKKRKKKKLPNT